MTCLGTYMKIFFICLMVLSFLASCSPSSPPYLLPVNDYLVQNIGHASFGGRVFCAIDLLGTASRDDWMDVYAWALCGEYYLSGKDLVLGSAVSVPVALHLQGSGGRYRVLTHEMPGNGTQYWSDVEMIFPPHAIRAMCPEDIACANERAQRLSDEIEQDAVEYYGVGSK